ncbi:uncharacterized protein LOC125192724 [Salvia hispanica]|uniref:uncharacterized protein LOC125192724 n=1 Tax=Salvia hispanica TaxID=49212 RepID=UPI00200966B9|nr:uncharacterized protein LOC125192724 [Salvia hispanica]
MILVYDYMSKGMLADYLHNQSTLSWSEWLKICIGAGRGSTSKYQNKVEVDKLSKAIPDGIPFIIRLKLISCQRPSLMESLSFDLVKQKDIDADYFSLMRNEFARVLENGENATIERLHYMPKHEFELRAKHVNVVELDVCNLDGRQQHLAYASLHNNLHEQQGIVQAQTRISGFNMKYNVYNFGEILVELLTGRKIVDNTLPAGQRHLVSWMAQVAQWCLRNELYDRPNMSEVVRQLELCLPGKKPQLIRPKHHKAQQ